MSEKEIDLGSPEKPKPVNSEVPPTPTPTPTPPTPVPSELKPDASSAEVVDFLLNQSQENLLPWQTIELPSQGLYYGGRIPNGKIEVRAMGLYTDKILATARLAQTGQALDEVFRRCVRFPDTNFDPLDLLVGDRIFLLFYLRGITHGNNYEFVVTCNNEICGTKFTDSYDLNQLAETIKRPMHTKEPVKVKLPYLSEYTKREVWVEIRFMRGKDLQAMSKKQKFVQKATGQHSQPKNAPRSARSITVDQTVEENLNLLIESINGVKDRHKIQQIVQSMHGRDTGAIRQVLRDDAPGIDVEIAITCPECGNEMNMELPITETFFRPQDTGGM